MDDQEVSQLYTAVCGFIRRGQTERIAEAFSGLNVDEITSLLRCQDARGNCLLHVAAEVQVLPIMQYLVGLYQQHELPVNTVNKEGQTPRDVASALGNRLVADFLEVYAS